MNTAHPDLLVAEDNPLEAKLLQLALRAVEPALRVVFVRDGAEALERIAACAPRLVALDLKMPKLDGLEVLRHLKSDPATRELPIVIFTSSSEEVDRAACAALNAAGYFVKPIGFDGYREVARRLVQTLALPKAA